MWGGADEKASIDDILGWQIDDDFKTVVDEILVGSIPAPVGPEFMAPPPR
jgi:hypothetical protein